MKSFIAFAAFVAIAVAAQVKPVPITELDAIVAAINSPSTDPATAALLEQQLQDILDSFNPEPIAVGPAIVPQPIVNPEQTEFEPISVGPALVEFPESDGGAVTAPIVPSPVVIGPIPEGAPTPLVQIILNIKQTGPIVPAPIVRPDPTEEVAEAEPVQVIETAPIAVEPVIIGTPILPSPAVVLPEELN